MPTTNPRTHLTPATYRCACGAVGTMDETSEHLKVNPGPGHESTRLVHYVAVA